MRAFLKNLHINMQKISESTKIRQRLDGLQRIRDEKVDISNHHYLTLSELNSWFATNSVPFARGVLLDYGCGGKPY